MLVRKCDCCECEISDNEFYYNLKVFEYKNDAHHQVSFPHIDLCNSCYKELDNYYYKEMKLKCKKFIEEDSK